MRRKCLQFPIKLLNPIKNLFGALFKNNEDSDVFVSEVKAIMGPGFAGCKLSGGDPFFEKSK